MIFCRMKRPNALGQVLAKRNVAYQIGLNVQGIIVAKEEPVITWKTNLVAQLPQRERCVSERDVMTKRRLGRHVPPMMNVVTING